MTNASPPPELPLSARLYNVIMKGFVQNGRAPHYVEIGRALGIAPEEARQALHQLLAKPGPNWLFPETDYIGSFAPFSSIPTQYLVSVDGVQRWYAQCGFEALAITWLFPGKEVKIDCPCLDCGEPITVRMRDGKLLEVNPPTVVGHTNRARRNWAEDYPLS